MLTGFKQLNRYISIKTFHLLLGICGLGFVALITYSPYIPYSITIQPGHVVSKTIVSPRFIEFSSKADQVKTKNLRTQRASLIEPVYSINDDINKSIHANIVNLFTQIRLYLSEKVKTSDLPIPSDFRFINKQSWTLLSTMDTKALASIEYFTLQLNEKLLHPGLSTIDSSFLRKTIRTQLRPLELGRPSERFISRVILHFIQPNLIYDEAKTSELVNQEIQSIQPYTTTYREGQPIIYKGEVVV